MGFLLWIDMEMTGLDVSKERIIEVAALVTDYDFNEKDSYHSVVRQPNELLAAMDNWNKDHHSQSGLLNLIPNGKSEAEVEHDLIALVKKNFGQEKAIIAGNSVGQDRLFINKYFLKLAGLLHYRMLDISSWKIILQEKFKVKYSKKNAHRALDDIRESIEELKFYLNYFAQMSSKKEQTTGAPRQA